MDRTLPIVIVAPTLKRAQYAATRLNLPYREYREVVFVTNGTSMRLEGLRATRFRTFFIEPDDVDRRIKDALEQLWALADGLEIN